MKYTIFPEIEFTGYYTTLPGKFVRDKWRHWYMLFEGQSPSKWARLEEGSDRWYKISTIFILYMNVWIDGRLERVLIRNVKEIEFRCKLEA